jgi:hypothetical protein
MFNRRVFYLMFCKNLINFVHNQNKAQNNYENQVSKINFIVAIYIFFSI